MSLRVVHSVQAGSEGIDTVTSHLVQVWRCLNTPLEATAVAAAWLWILELIFRAVKSGPRSRCCEHEEIDC